MIDIMALREAYERNELMDIRWIDGRDNPADAMTKSTPNTALDNLINNNELELRVQGWVDRSQPQGIKTQHYAQLSDSVANHDLI